MKQLTLFSLALHKHATFKDINSAILKLFSVDIEHLNKVVNLYK